ncbi:MAG: DNA repair protein RecO, partial [Gammaproteobacteria bacterium]
LRLLKAIGYGLNLERDAVGGEPVIASAWYRFKPEQGLVRVEDTGSGGLIVQGATLIDLAAGEFPDNDRMREARKLLRAALDQQLGGRQLKTREVLRGLARYEIPPAVRN